MACLSRTVVVLIISAAGLAVPGRAAAYSVLAHEALVDSAWTAGIGPMLQRRFPDAPAERIARARAFAYGGAVIQDLGYYPFGSTLFTDLLHYVRSGDFIEALVRNAGTVEEYAFALGALAHYAADTVGHAVAVNRSVPLVYPKLREKFGPVVTYDEDPKRHVMVEFAFDVVQVVGNGYEPAQYADFIGFEVATSLLERTFEETYGLKMADLFADVDFAVGTYRYLVGKLIPDITRAAWRSKRDEILKTTPDARQSAFVYAFDREAFERRFGTTYRTPGPIARFLVFLVKLLPKVGPLSALAFRLPTPEAERLFLESFDQARRRYRTLLERAAGGRFDLQNADFDTGRPSKPGEYRRADQTYVKLRERLARKAPAEVPAAVRLEIERFFGADSTR